MNTLVTHYCPDYRNREAWITLDHLILFDKAVKQYYVTYSQGLDYEYPTSKKDFESQRRMRWYWQNYIPLSKPVQYEPHKRLWLNSQGRLVYACKKKPREDESAVCLGTVPNRYRFGFQVDVRQVQRQLDKHAIVGQKKSSTGHLLANMQAIVFVMRFCEAYQIDPAKISQAVEEAMPCLNQNQARVLRLRFGGSGGRPRDWKLVADEMSLSYERVRQIYQVAIRKLKKRIRCNQALKRLGMPILTDESPHLY